MDGTGRAALPLVRTAVSFAAAGAAAFGWWTYAGPYRWLAELQVFLLGGYAPLLTGLAVLATVFLVADVSVRMVLAPDADADAEPPLWEQRLGALAASWRVRVALLGAGFLGVSGWNAREYWRAGPLAEVPAATIAAGRSPSSYVRVDLSSADFDRAVGANRGVWVDWYVPLASGTETAVFVTASTGGDDPLDEEALNNGVGMILGTGLPAELAGRYPGALAETTWVVDTGVTPAERETTSLVFGGLGAALLGVAALIQLARGPLWRSAQVVPMGQDRDDR